MKKLLAFIICAVMCISLVACGSSKYDKYEDLINAIEEDDFQQAMKELYKIYEEKQNMTDIFGNKESDEETTDPEVEAMEASVIGEWTVYNNYYSEESEYTTVIIKDDNTATVDDESFTWELDYAEKDYATFVIKNGDTNAYRLQINKQEEGYHCATLFKYNDDGNSYRSVANLYRLDEFTKIELTKDNFFDYFEKFETSKVETYTNDFGEVTSTEIRVKKGFVLKEEYGTVISDITNVPIEYSYREMDVNVSGDPATGEYHMGEVTDYDTDREPYTSVTSLDDIDWSNDVYELGLSFGGFVIYEFPVDEIYNICTDFELIRVAGVIYTYTPAE